MIQALIMRLLGKQVIDNYDTLAEEAATLREVNKSLMDALAFYANEESYEGEPVQTASEFWLHPWLLKPAVSNRRKSSETNIWPLMDRRSDSATTRPGCSSNSYMPDKIRLTIHQRNGNFGVV